LCPDDRASGAARLHTRRVHTGPPKSPVRRAWVSRRELAMYKGDGTKAAQRSAVLDGGHDEGANQHDRHESANKI